MSDKYRLKVRRVPLTESVPIVSKPRFPPMDELYLDLIENKDKVRRNAPKPIYVRSADSGGGYPSHESGGDSGGGHGNHSDAEPQIDDFTLEELEREYDNRRSGGGGRSHSSGHDSDSDVGEVDSDIESSRSYSRHNHESSRHESSRSAVPEPSRSQPESYSKSEFAEPEAEEEEDPEVVERREKSEYLVKFMILRKHYPELDIPEFTEHSDLKSMKMAYEHAFRLTSLDESVEQYRMYIYGSSMALEWVSTNWFGFDMNGFARSQQKSINRYDRLLFELGEKNYSPTGSRFPVEVRLLFMMLVQAAFFAFTKAQQNSSGISASASNSRPSASEPVPSFGGGLATGGARKTATATKSAPTRRRMQGPTIKPEDVGDMLGEQESPDDVNGDGGGGGYGKRKDD